MKKLFSLALVLFAMLFAANAQYLLNEGFEDPNMSLPTGWTVIDNDGDGNNWYVLNNSQSSQGGFNVHSGDGHITSASYSGAALTPDNWLITPQINLTSNSTLTFWMAGQDPSWAAEYFSVYVATSPTVAAFTATTPVVSGTTTGTMTQYTVDLSPYTGQQVYIAFRHHNISDMFRINLDDVQISASTTDPTIVTSSHNINFGTTLLGTESTQQVSIATFNLTSGITATTTAPFSVSADGTTYGTTATIAQTGGTLYVKYTPTTVGANSDIVVLSSTGATNDTISVTGNCLDCNNPTIPYTCDFSNSSQNQCWTIVDGNNDGTTFTFTPSGAYASYHWHSTNAANDWLISPAFTFTGTQNLTFDYRTGSSYREIYEVFAIGSDTVRLCQPDTVQSANYVTKILDVSGLNGSYSIAFHCISEAGQYYLYISNFNLLDNSTAIVSVDQTGFNYGTVPVGSTLTGTFHVNTTNLNEPIVISTSAPFQVSVDNTTFGATATIPADTTFITSTPVYVRFAPTAAGTFNDVAVVTTTVSSDTLSLTGIAVECNAITTFPFVETFDATSTTLPCWEVVDANNDNNSFGIASVGGNAAVAYTYSDNVADDYLISPEITVSAGLYGHIDYWVYSANYPEKFSIYVIPANGTIANAVNIVPTVTAINTSAETQNFDLSPYVNQTIRIAIKAESDPDMWRLYFDNFTIEEVPAASMDVTPASMTFTASAGGTSVAQTANVTAFSLTNDITVSTAAPFEVSADGTTYGTTATIAQASIINAPIYIRYAPTTPGNQTGSVTLTSGSLTATINVSGTAIDCSGIEQLPFAENFDSALPQCWTILDEDGDGYTWVSSTDPYDYFVADADISGSGHNGSNGFILSGSYTNVTQTALTPDNWLITPPLAIPTEGATLSFFVAAQDASYANEHYGVYVSTTGTSASDFTLLYEETIDANGGSRAQGTWKEKIVNLPYGGQTIHIAIRHFNCSDMFLLDIDDFNVVAGMSGIQEHEVNVNVYPNPANDIVNVNASSNISTIEVFNMMGQKVSAFDANNTTANINVAALANGIYMMRINTENGVVNQKFTVAR